MRMYDVILKKRNGGELSKEEIGFVVNGYVRGEIPDYQMAALLMAIYFRGMTDEETVNLTLAMADSGEKVDLSEIPGIKVDKHSSGGVGDKTTIALVPLVASAGVPVAKLSGRALGHTGGTVDKLESIPGFSTALDARQIVEQVKRIGAAIGGQMPNLVPADKKIYALRDVTATIDSIPLIASSIMSKKIAGGADAIVLDVKVGTGAFIKDIDTARELAKKMVAIGSLVGKKTVALLTNMDQPLGNAVGNALEVMEAIETLKGRGPADFAELVLTLGSYMLVLGGKAKNPREARIVLEEHISDGSALNKFKEIIEAQGGDPRVIDDFSLLPQAPRVVALKAWESGFISHMNTEEIGLACMELGAGREKKEDKIDLSVGLVFRKKLGDRVEKGETIVEIHGRGDERIKKAMRRLKGAISIGSERPNIKPLVMEVVG